MRKSVLMRMIVMAIAIVMTTGLAIAMSACGHEHEFGEWVVYKEATCTQTGVQYRTCECGEEERKNIPATGHTEGDWVVDIEPTCVEEGSKSKRCTTCSAAIINVDIGKLGHHYPIEWTVDLEPTCTANGSKSRHCSRCDDKKDVTKIPANGHSDGEWITDIDPTCTEDGSKHQVCSVCNDTIATDVIAPLGHSLGAWTQTLAPTCTEEGKERRDCEACEHFETQEIPALGHTYTEWIQSLAPTCTEEGISLRCCLVCNNWDRKAITPYGHISGEWITDANPTCTENGSRHQICSVCTATIKTEVIPAKGHTHIATTTSPTHTEKGYTTFTCACGDTYTGNYVDALGHSYTTEVTSKTCAKDATIVYTCSCGDSYAENIAPIVISFTCTGSSQTTIDGYGTYTRYYDIGATGGYGAIQFKFELFKNSTAITPTDAFEFSTDTEYSITSRGYSFSAGDSVVQITAKDDYGNVSVYRFKVSDESVIDSQVVLEHTAGEWITEKQATCTEEGLDSQMCTVCGATIQSVLLPALGHTDGEWITDKEATCTANGSKHQVCSVCTATIKTEVIDKLPHTYIAEHDLTYLNTYGFDKYTCDVCGYTAYLDRAQNELELADLVLSNDGTAIMSCNNIDTAELLIIPNSVTSIADNDLFVYCANLKHVLFGSQSIKIRLQGSPIEHIYIPSHISAWLPYCSELKTVIWADGVRQVDSYDIFGECIGRTLHGSSVQSIVIPVSVECIKSGVFRDATKLTTVYYMGTADEWNNIDIEQEDNMFLIEATKYYYSETQPTDTTYQYWHYVDGVPTLW